MPSRKRSFTQVPFNANGDLLTYTPHSSDYDPPEGRYLNEETRRKYSVEWRPADDFEAVLRLETFTRGRSAAHFILFDSLGHQYTMFLTDFVHAIKTAGARPGGEIAGKFEFVKRGQNYGVRLLESTAVDVKLVDEDGVNPLGTKWHTGCFGSPVRSEDDPRSAEYGPGEDWALSNTDL